MLEANAVVQNGATTGNGTALQLGGQCDGLRAYIQGSAGVASGAVQLEEAADENYAGTWSPIGSPIAVVASAEVVVAAPAGGIMAVRARISTTIGSGTVTVRLVAYSGAGE